MGWRQQRQSKEVVLIFILYANKNQLTVRKREPVTSGSVNVYRARFEFSDDWEGLTRKAVFQAGGKKVSVLLDESGVCDVPWEVLEKPMVPLEAGVYGTQNDTALPTTWANLGTVLLGAAPGDSARPPTPDIWQQELDGKGDVLDYDGLNLSLMSGNKPLSTVQIVGGGGGDGGPVYQIGHGLKLTGNTVSVDAVDNFEGDNTLPMTAAGVLSSVGNIEALLGTI